MIRASDVQKSIVWKKRTYEEAKKIWGRPYRLIWVGSSQFMNLHAVIKCFETIDEARGYMDEMIHQLENDGEMVFESDQCVSPDNLHGYFERIYGKENDKPSILDWEPITFWIPAS